MVVMKYFCFYFPVRSGVLITSLLSILQSVALYVYCEMHTEKDLKKICEDVKENIDDYSSNQAFDTLLDYTIRHTGNMRLAVIAFSFAVVAASILNMIAAILIWRWLTVPYILLELMRLCALLGIHVLGMMIFKKQLNLGVLIAASSFGGFFLLLLFYMWSCSISMFQIIGIVYSKSYKKMTSLSSPPPEKLQRNITISSVASNVKPLLIDTKYDPGIFASDFSEFYRKHQSYRM